MVAFLATHVKKPDKGNWVTLKHMLKYPMVTRELKLALSVSDMSVVKWWVDASYIFYEDCQ